MAEENKNGNGIQRDDGSRKGVLIPKDLDGIVFDVESAGQPKGDFNAPEGGTAGYHIKELFTQIDGNNITAQQGLKELAGSAYSIRQDMDARVETPVLEDGTKLWGTWLDSKTMQFYGGVNEDKRHRFKIDHEFDISSIVNAGINSDGTVSIDDGKYMQSKGTEFIIIEEKDLKGTKADYAIRADKYEAVKEQLNKRKLKAAELEKAGGFKINADLTPSEIPVHDGWLELAVGKNKASKEDYAEAARFLKEEYIPKADENDCFRDTGRGMGFYVETGRNDFRVRPWYVNNSNYWSIANNRNGFGDYGHFLRVRDSAAAEGGAPQDTGYKG